MGTVGNKEKKQFLWGYRDSLRRIERIESEIAEIRSMKMGASACGGAGRKGWKHDLSDYVAKLDEWERRLEKERENRVRIYRAVEKAINSLEDTREQDVLFYRYIKGLTWWEIAERIGCTERHTRRLHGQALLNLKIKDVLECPE